jgi:DNA repair protein RecO (recombination protein O)
VAATEPYTWSNVEYYEKNGVKWVKNASARESFAGIRYDIDKLFLAAYIADVTAELSDEREPAGEILPLSLNALYKLSGDGECDRVKAAFELRAACIAGFAPNLGICDRCHGELSGDVHLDVMNGCVICRECFLHAQNQLIPVHEELGERVLLLPMNPSALAAFTYVCTAAPKRIFAFRLADEESRAQLSAAAEAYLLHHLERGFASLENYKKLAAMAPKKNKT